MCRTNGLKKIYESELNRKSKYYEVFDALLRRFRYVEAMICQEAGAVDSHDTGRLLLGNEELYMKYNADVNELACSYELRGRLYVQRNAALQSADQP